MVVYVVSSTRRLCVVVVFFFQAEDGIRDLVRSRGLGDVYKRQPQRGGGVDGSRHRVDGQGDQLTVPHASAVLGQIHLSLIHI